MRVYLERFIIPILASLLAAVLTGQFAVSATYRTQIMLGVAGVALIAALVAQRTALAQVDRDSDAKSRFFSVVLILAACATAGSYLLVRSHPTLLTSAHSQSTGTAADQKQVGQQQQPSSELGSARTAVPQTSNPPIRDGVSTEPNGSGRHDLRQWAVLIAAEEDTGFPELKSTVSDALASKGHNITEIRHNPEAFGNAVELRRALARQCDGLVAAKRVSAISESTDLDKLLTARVTLDVRILSISEATTDVRFRLEENGAGFTAADANSRANERIAKQLRERLSVIP
ncbi:MAG: hypothetical protein LAN64_07860 [Acidobacteriia bacterium]|nr:hypothetical protein [Terriglobia bacterium]